MEEIVHRVAARFMLGCGEEEMSGCSFRSLVESEIQEESKPRFARTRFFLDPRILFDQQSTKNFVQKHQESKKNQGRTLRGLDSSWTTEEQEQKRKQPEPSIER